SAEPVPTINSLATSQQRLFVFISSKCRSRGAIQIQHPTGFTAQKRVVRHCGHFRLFSVVFASHPDTQRQCILNPTRKTRFKSCEATPCLILRGDLTKYAAFPAAI